VSTTEQEIEDFARFAKQRLSDGASGRSLDELFDMWRTANPSAEELTESVGAVKAALCDMEAGDTGIPADEHLAQLRSKFRIPQSR
jgi:hypothetical protein